MAWSIELFEYGLTFELKKPIKAQMLVGFLTNLIPKEQSENVITN